MVGVAGRVERPAFLHLQRFGSMTSTSGTKSPSSERRELSHTRMQCEHVSEIGREAQGLYSLCPCASIPENYQ